MVLYRSYRHGDLPDVQIPHSSLIVPLQAVAQVGAGIRLVLQGLPLGGLPAGTALSLKWAC